MRKMLSIINWKIMKYILKSLSAQTCQQRCEYVWIDKVQNIVI